MQEASRTDICAALLHPSGPDTFFSRFKINERSDCAKESGYAVKVWVVWTQVESVEEGVGEDLANPICRIAETRYSAPL